MKVRSRPQWSGSGRHDLAYISSLLHDATFKLQEVYESMTWLVIPITRERLEIERDDGQQPVQIRSEILIGPVRWWTVELAGRFYLGENRLGALNLTIFGVQCSSGKFIVEDSTDEEIIVDCTGAKLRVRVGDEAEIQLVDLPPKRKRSHKQPTSIRTAAPMS